MKSEARTHTIEFSVEKYETFSIRRGRPITYVRCSGCRCKVQMLSPEDAAKLIGISTRKIYSDVEAGKTHFVESADGSIIVCLDSLRESE